ncbi:tryptophan-rich sensory protein [Parasulfitobacter algicola]|uniref:Tryptophan-rich sensory protein n=1 Tax=Parasulfitobacter algicola TaxID=2614809 RepID=A0ABX2J024_9RHOB|nr:tryptophan-rich sensory protein [Sulfitobacter algicola]NSX56353.1 tryptophan-rich sensory protein [Sulfitobacter algicola]
MKTLKAILVLITASAFALMPFFVADFSGFKSDQLPFPQIDPPIQPAGYAFSIWGLIYLWLLLSAVYGLIKRVDDDTWDRTRLPLIISLGIGAAWLPVALSSAEWATALIIVMLAGALIALLRAPSQDRWWLQAPIAIYAGWLTAASLVSIAILGAGYGIGTSVTWAYISLTCTLALAIYIQTQKPSAPEYGLTIIWALVAIIIANAGSNLGIQIYAGFGILLLIGLKSRSSLPA